MKILLTIHQRLTHNARAAGCTLKLEEEYQKLGHQVSYFSFNDLPSYSPDLAKEVLFTEYVASHIVKFRKNTEIDREIAISKQRKSQSNFLTSAYCNRLEHL